MSSITSSSGSTAQSLRLHRGITILLMFFLGVFLFCFYLYPGVSNNLSQKLEQEVRVLCWVMTTPAYHKSRAIHVRNTWGKRCNRLIFVTSEFDPDLGDSFIAETEDVYAKLWNKTILAFKHVYRVYGDEADWFLKADDDAYVFVENLRYFLYAYRPEIPIYFGYNLKYNNQSYMSGGSGYVLSREALRRFVEEAIQDKSKCDITDELQIEDVTIGKCLAAVGVAFGDSRDVHNQMRFYPFGPYTALMSNYFTKDFWFNNYSYFHVRTCQDCLAKYAVGFHYVSKEEMYVYDFFAHQFEADGLNYSSPKLPGKLDVQDISITSADNSILDLPV